MDAVREVPPDRINILAYADKPWYGGFLDDIDQFDPAFFGISPREAETHGPAAAPAARGQLGGARAGRALRRTSCAASQTGVFVGVSTNDYGQLIRQDGLDNVDVYSATGCSMNVIAGRVSYTLGLNGPRVAIDTACSSSLVALHLACKACATARASLALAGGVNVLLSPDGYVCFSKWGMMAPDGRCKTFDARADGFVRSEGCGVVVLKRLVRCARRRRPRPGRGPRLARSTTTAAAAA